MSCSEYKGRVGEDGGESEYFFDCRMNASLDPSVELLEDADCEDSCRVLVFWNDGKPMAKVRRIFENMYVNSIHQDYLRSTSPLIKSCLSEDLEGTQINSIFQ